MSLKALRRKLEAWELEHLRQHCAEQAQRIEELEQQLRYTESIADQWQREAESYREHLMNEDKTICLNIDGQVEVV
jgi:hypothetical protein